MKAFPLLWAFWAFWGPPWVLAQVGPDLSHCEPLSLKHCQNLSPDLRYNLTHFPNMLGHKSQEEAGKDLTRYHPLIKIGCSKDIHMFLCVLFAPVCTIVPEVLPPCRGLCYSARVGCKDLLAQFGYTWPELFNCDRFPVGGQPDQLCVGSSEEHNVSEEELLRWEKKAGKGKGKSPWATQRPKDYARMMNFTCPVQLQMPAALEYKLRVGEDQVIPDCGAPCYHNITFFDRDQIREMHTWIFAFSLLCVCSCLFTLATFFVDRARFPYPERPIVFLTLCYLGIAIVQIAGYAHEEDIACNKAMVNSSMNFLTERTIKQGTLHDWRCTLTATALYFFLMSGSLWWVVLTVTWYLSAGLKWSQEGIDAKSQWFHGVAWMVPIVQTMVVLIMKKVEGDVLSGVCFVGLWDADNLLYFVLIPLLVYLVLGTFFLILGFISLIRIRTVMKHDGTKTDKLERLIFRIGIFSLLYTGFSAVLLGCYWYEQRHLPEWTQLWQEQVCRSPLFNRWQTPCRFPDGQEPDVDPPRFYVFLLKYLSLLAIGIISGCWFWSRKTLTTWKMWFLRITGSGQQNPEYV